MLIKGSLKSIIKCIKYDWHRGTICEWKKFIPILVVMCFSCIRLWVVYAQGREMLGWWGELSVGDFMFWNFKGMKVVRDLKNSFFVLDGVWIFFHLYLAYVIGFYPFRDMKNNSHLLLIRSEKRICWWLGKCTWVMSNVLVYYIITFLIIVFWALMLGENEWAVQEQIMKNMYEITEFEHGSIVMYTACMGLSALISMGISLIQMTVSVILNPIVGFGVTAAILVTSVYVFHPFLPGNYMMLLRNKMFLMGNGVTIINGFWLAILMIIFSIIVGYVLFKKKDIYPDEAR